MEHRKRHSTPIILKVFMVVLLILAMPSWSLSQQPNPKSKAAQHLSKMKELDAQESREQQLLYPPSKKELGIISSIYHTIMMTGFKNGTADVIAGAKDTSNPENTAVAITHIRSDGSMVGSSGVSVQYDSKAGPEKTPGIDPDYFKTELEPTQAEKLIARVKAKRAKKALKVAQVAAQQDKKTARTQAAKAAVDNQSSGCFPDDIRVIMADGTSRSIADVQAGDRVLTYDIGYDKVVGKPVLAAYSVTSNHLYTINNELKATGGERVLTQSGWRVLSALTQEDRVHSNGRMIDVDTIAYKRMELKTYNLQVDDTHNFYVQTESGDTYLVHNSCGGK